MFKVGQRVLCVNDDVHAFVPRGMVVFHSLHGLTKGFVYTVRFCGTFRIPIIGEYLGVRVREIIRAPGIDVPYDHRRFQPLRKTSIDVFTQLLVKVPELVE